MPPLVDVVPVGALLVLLATAYAHPRGRVEALVGRLAAAATIATGIVGWDLVRGAVADLAPVVLFLATILVVADVCARAGLFEAAAHLVRSSARGRSRRLLTGVPLLAPLGTTAVLAALLGLNIAPG